MRGEAPPGAGELLEALLHLAVVLPQQARRCEALRPPPHLPRSFPHSLRPLHHCWTRLTARSRRSRPPASSTAAALTCSRGAAPHALGHPRRTSSMTAISVTSVNVLDNPSKVTNPLQFEIQYECMFDLADGEQGRAGPGRASRGPGGDGRRCVGGVCHAAALFQPPCSWLHPAAYLLAGHSALSAPPCGCHAQHRGCCRSARAPQAAAAPCCRPPGNTTAACNCPTAAVPLSADLEWKLTYVGSAESEKYDQVHGRTCGWGPGQAAQEHGSASLHAHARLHACLPAEFQCQPHPVMHVAMLHFYVRTAAAQWPAPHRSFRCSQLPAILHPSAGARHGVCGPCGARPV